MLEIDIDRSIGRVGSILSENEKKKGVIMTSLQRIQAEEGFLPAPMLQDLAEALDLTLAEVYGVATFYKQFHFTPRGRTIVKVCTGTACHVRGAQKILTTLKNEFDMEEGETTADLALTLETVGCVGCCGLAPVAVMNDKVIGEVGLEKTKNLVQEIKEEENESAD